MNIPPLNSNAKLLMKANANDFTGRFREIISDPLNLAIKRVPHAGATDGGIVYLHNGIKVQFTGPYAYYDEFSTILMLNRGVHEPLEEFVFQELFKHLPEAPRMLELGAYWGHYSMWLKSTFPQASVCLVEPDDKNYQSGVYNFQLNDLDGEFIKDFVGNQHFSVDQYFLDKKIDQLNILHSDIQGYELEMLNDCSIALQHKKIDYIFVSTHSQQIHVDAIHFLERMDYRVEVSSDFENDTTSFDGFIFASSSLKCPVFEDFTPIGRTQLQQENPMNLVNYLSKIVARQ